MAGHGMDMDLHLHGLHRHGLALNNNSNSNTSSIDFNRHLYIIMTQDKNIVRDRTLVLRVLVPGLHTSLHDKINPNRTTKDEPAAAAASSSSSSSSPWSAEGASTSLLSGPSMMDSTRGDHQQHQILNLDGVSCIPSSKGSTLWHFRCDGATYPARLVNLPW